MKNTRETNLELPFITWELIEEIAITANCTPRYAWMIITGDRDANSAKARGILRAAKKLNASIERSMNTVKRALETIDAD